MTLIDCCIPRCKSRYEAREPVAPKARFICRYHTRADQVHAANRPYDPLKDEKDREARFQNGGFEPGFADRRSFRNRPHGAHHIQSGNSRSQWDRNELFRLQETFKRIARSEGLHRRYLCRDYVSAHARGKAWPLSVLASKWTGLPFAKFEIRYQASDARVLFWSTSGGSGIGIDRPKSRQPDEELARRQRRIPPSGDGMHTIERSQDPTVEQKVSAGFMWDAMIAAARRGEYDLPTDPPESREVRLINGQKIVANRQNAKFMNDVAGVSIFFGWDVGSKIAEQKGEKENTVTTRLRRSQIVLAKLERLKQLGVQDPFAVDRVLKLPFEMLLEVITDGVEAGPPDSETLDRFCAEHGRDLYALIEQNNNRVLVYPIGQELTTETLDEIYSQLAGPAVLKERRKAPDRDAMFRNCMAVMSRIRRQVGAAQYISTGIALRELQRRREELEQPEKA